MTRTRTMLWAALACLVAAAIPLSPLARAEEPPKGEEVPLSLADALRTALQNNLDLEIARKAPRVAELNVDLAKGIFDPVLGATYGHQQSASEPISQNVWGEQVVRVVTTSSSSKGDTGTASWQQLVNFGGTYIVEFQTGRFDQIPLRSAFNPTISSGLRLAWEMPLLKTFGKEYQTQGIVTAKRDLQASEEILSGQAQLTLETVEGAYWDLLAARKALEVARESLKLAQDLYDLNKKKVEVGTLAPIEITQAEAGVASREEGVIVAETMVQNAEDNLRKLMAIPKNDAMWGRTIIPTDRPQFEPRSPDLDNSLEKAMESRPDLKSAKLDLLNKQLLERTTKSDTKDDLRFSAEITPAGNNSSSEIIQIENPIPPYDPPMIDQAQSIKDSYWDSVLEIPKFKNYDWRVGLTYTHRIGNRQAKANYAKATIGREEAELNVQNVEQTVRVDVRTAVRAVESGVKRVAAARANTVLQRKTVDAEQKKFENGMSTSFEVLRIQNDLFSAQLAEIQAILAYNKALVALERAQGTLLDARGLRLDTGKVN